MIGALTAIIATIIPPFLIISLISVFYSAFRSNYIVSEMLEGMQAGVGAVIAAVVFEMAGGIVHGRSPIIYYDHDSCIYCDMFLRSKCDLCCPCLWCDRSGEDIDLEKEGEEMIYLELFWSFLQIGCSASAEDMRRCR